MDSKKASYVWEFIKANDGVVYILHTSRFLPHSPYLIGSVHSLDKFW